MKKSAFIFLALFILSGIGYWLLFAHNFSVTGNTIKQEVFVSRVIDGDTVELGSGIHVRLLGINTPEKKQPFHDEAMNALKVFVENRSVEMEVIAGNEKDKYGRTLGYLFLESSFVNKLMLEQGMANLYVYGSDLHTKELTLAEETARESGIGIWKKSLDADCLKLVNLQWYEGAKRCTNNEQLVLENLCNKTLSVIIKDSANHIDNENLGFGKFVKNYSCVWNDEGDNLIIRDSQGLLVFDRYP